MGQREYFPVNSTVPPIGNSSAEIEEQVAILQKYMEPVINTSKTYVTLENPEKVNTDIDKMPLVNKNSDDRKLYKFEDTNEVDTKTIQNCNNDADSYCENEPAGKNFICKHCNISLTSLEGLTLHQRTQHDSLIKKSESFSAMKDGKISKRKEKKISL